MATFLAARTSHGLQPVDEAGEAVLRRIPRGEIMRVEIRRPRNIRHHRLFFVLMSVVWENLDQERYPTIDDLVAAIKIAAGLRTRIELPDGMVGFVPGSIAFHRMDQAAFDEFYDRVCDLICKYFLPGVTSEELRAEVEEMTGLAAPEMRG